MQDKKKKILIVHNYYQIPGGEDTVVANEKKMLENHGHEVILYTRNNSELKNMTKMQKVMLPLATIFNYRTYRDIKRLIVTEKIEIVHVHNTLTLISPAVYYAACSCKIPVVQTMHNFRLLCPGATFYRDGHICEDCVRKGLWCAVRHGCYRGSRLQTLVCVISTVFHRMTGIYGKLNYICLTEFNKVKLLQLKQVKPDHIFIKPNFTFAGNIRHTIENYYLYMGKMEKIEGVNLLLEAFEMLPDYRLLLTGMGTEFEMLQVEYAHCKNITFEGFLQREELNQVLAGAKAVIVTSQRYETFGLIVEEAFANHVPVIVGDIENVGSLVDDGINGIKFRYNSVEALKQAIVHFEKMDAKVMGKAAYEKYTEEFWEKKTYHNIKCIYQTVGGVTAPMELLYRYIFYCRKDQFVFVGRLDELKGIDLLLHTWHLLGNNFPKLVVCGTGPLNEWCRNFIKEKDIQNVDLRGFVSNNDVKKIISESRAMILPTRWYEGFPMSLVEAYSVGTPVIGPNMGNVNELIWHDITGLTFQYNDELSLREVIHNFRKQEWNAVKKIYEDYFGVEKNYCTLAWIYGKVNI